MISFKYSIGTTGVALKANVIYEVSNEDFNELLNINWSEYPQDDI